jgi:predicted RNA-binding Zn ribbon-like protein
MSQSYDERAGVSTAPGRLELVRQFLNTISVEKETDEFQTCRGAWRWLVTQGLVGRNERVSEPDRIGLIDLRERLRALAFAHNGLPLADNDLARLNKIASEASIGAIFQGSDDVLLVRGKGNVDDAVSALLAIVCDSIREGTWPRLKACRNATGCGWAFYDNSRNRVGAWCSMAVCGNRAKTRAYRQRKRAAS